MRNSLNKTTEIQKHESKWPTESVAHEVGENDDIQLNCLILAIEQKYGYDFSHYARASFKRRIYDALQRFELPNMAVLQDHILDDAHFFKRLLDRLTIIVTDFFRDPFLYKALREHVVPYLRTYPQIKIWQAGCSTGEETYALAMLLQEEGLYERSLIYATDINQSALDKARAGIFDLSQVKKGSKFYFESGGKTSMATYFHTEYEYAAVSDALKKKIVFSYHNLATDQAFGEMQLILCRNVVIYFDRQLQERTFSLFNESLCRGGFLSLGAKETLSLSAVYSCFDCADLEARLYRKKMFFEALSDG